MQRFVLILVCCAGFYFLLFSAFRSLTDVGELRNHYPRVHYDAKTETSTIEVVKQRPPNWVAIQDISSIASAAIVLSEDWAFWQHNGFDWNQVWDAFETNFKKGRFARGGSTITQQVIKNVYLSNEKTLIRKAKEAVLTMRIERHVRKRRILEIYLNIAELGPGIYGIGPASRYYFQKPASSLTAKEGAFLAMLLPSPKRYGASFRKKGLTPFARGAIKSILGKLQATHRLSDEEYRQALGTPLSFEHNQLPAPESPPEDEEEEDVPSVRHETGDPAAEGAAPRVL